MPDHTTNLENFIQGFKLDGMMMRYSVFMPRLYNYCKSLGMEAGKIMPSRAFCSDENQGYPVILIAKHFGAFPFNHGRVGGIVATDRHGPHGEHGKDLVIIQASHVGYEPQTKKFGIYRRIQTQAHECTPTCGKVHYVIEWYKNEYDFACHNIYLHRQGNDHLLTIDNQLFHTDRNNGLFLHLDKLLHRGDDGSIQSVHSHSTSRTYKASDDLVTRLKGVDWQDGDGVVIGKHLLPDMFYFKRDIPDEVEGQQHLEINLLRLMPYIVTSGAPELVAAKVNTRMEFDRTFRTIVKNRSYRGKRVLYISGLNIDISPQGGQLFPLTKFVPWAAYVQEPDGQYSTLEQDALMQVLSEQSTDNPDQIDLEQAIASMSEAEEVRPELP